VVAFPAWATLDVAGIAVALGDSPARTVVCVPVALGEGEGRGANLTSLSRDLRRAGVDVLPWEPADDLSAALGPALVGS